MMIKVATACVLLHVASAIAATPALSGAPRDGWAAYQVPMLPGRGAPCCHIIRGAVTGTGCDLDRDRGVSISSDTPRSVSGDALTVYLHFDAGKVDRVRGLAASCPVRSETPVVSLAGIDADASLQLLRTVAEAGVDKHDGGGATAAIAFHAAPQATAVLSDLAARSRPEELRENAVLWLGMARGAEGVAVVERIARDAADAMDVRRQALLALAQSDADTAYPVLADLAARDASGEIRSQSMFWMAQSGDARARADILASLRRETDSDVQEQAVFALSQLTTDSDAALIELVRSDASRDVKKRALFWLGQSGSPEAMQLLDDVLAGAAR